MSQEKAVDIEIGQFYWLKDNKKEYIPALLTNISIDNNGSIQSYRFEIYQTNEIIVKSNDIDIISHIPHPGEKILEKCPDDLVDNDDISEPAILWSLDNRFSRDKIYSGIGSIIVAINPYKYLEELYSPEALNLYLSNQPSSLNRNVYTKYDILPPHVWIISQQAYYQLQIEESKQAIIISGESGAGKTEATKKCLQYLSAISLLSHNISSSQSSVAIEDRVLGTNPLLESFGNAKTSRNNNSSRFGKFLSIQFEKDNKYKSKMFLIGANITQYLLEKSRVVFQSDKERNYHIFYQLCSDKSLGLLPPKDYNFLNQSGIYTIEGVNDFEDWNLTLKSFKDLNFKDEQTNAIISILKSILMLGNIIISADNNTNDSIINDPNSLNIITLTSKLLSLQSSDMIKSFTTRTIKGRDEIVFVSLNQQQAIDVRNTFIKEIYNRLFIYIVNQCNKNLQYQSNNYVSDNLTIGLLDIFGFEIFDSNNSFEQLCINYANEKLQQYFINYIIKREQDIYNNENISYEIINPKDNNDILLLLEDKKIGIFNRLDEEIKLPNGSDSNYLKKITADHNNKSQTNNRFYKDIKMPSTAFMIKHFAGNVNYNVTDFLEKNRDKLYDHLELLLSNISNSFVFSILCPNITSSSSSKSSSNNINTSIKGKVSNTLASKFQFELNKLMTILNSSSPHFIRCIKPNDLKRANYLDYTKVLEQLRYSGVLEAITIRKNGYSIRRSHTEFRRSYWILTRISLKDLKKQNLLEADICRIVIDELINTYPFNYSDIQLGNTMVFLRPNILYQLEKEKLDIGLTAIIYIQKMYRKYICLNRFKEIKILHDRMKIICLESKSNNYNNMDSYDELVEFVEIYTDIYHLSGLIIKEASICIANLQITKDLINKLIDYVLTNKNADSSIDIVDQYLSGKSLLELCISKNLKHASVDELLDLLDKIKEKSEAIIYLRESINIFDDDNIKNALDIINRLNNTYGYSICSYDESVGNVIINHIKIIYDIIDICLNNLSDCYFKINKMVDEDKDNEINSELDTTRDNAPESNLDSKFDRNAIINTTNEILLSSISSYNTAICNEVITSDIRLRELIDQIINTIHYIYLLQQSILDNQFRNISNYMNEAIKFNDYFNLYVSNHSISKSMKSRCLSVNYILTQICKYIYADIENQLVIPTVNENLDKIILSSDSIAVIRTLIDEISEIGVHSQNTDLLVILLANLEYYLNCYFQSYYVNIYIYLNSENSIEDYNKITTLINDLLELSDDNIRIPKIYTTLELNKELLPMGIIIKRINSLKSGLHTIAIYLYSIIDSMYRLASNYIVKHLLEISISIGKITISDISDSIDGVDTSSNASIESLLLVRMEINSMYIDSSFLIMDNELKSTNKLLELLIKIRSLIISSSWVDIYNDLLNFDDNQYVTYVDGIYHSVNESMCRELIICRNHSIALNIFNSLINLTEQSIIHGTSVGALHYLTKNDFNNITSYLADIYLPTTNISKYLIDNIKILMDYVDKLLIVRKLVCNLIFIDDRQQAFDDLVQTFNLINESKLSNHPVVLSTNLINELSTLQYEIQLHNLIDKLIDCLYKQPIDYLIESDNNTINDSDSNVSNNFFQQAGLSINLILLSESISSILAVLNDLSNYQSKITDNNFNISADMMIVIQISSSIYNLRCLVKQNHWHKFNDCVDEIKDILITNNEIYGNKSHKLSDLFNQINHELDHCNQILKIYNYLSACYKELNNTQFVGNFGYLSIDQSSIVSLENLKVLYGNILYSNDHFNRFNQSMQLIIQLRKDLLEYNYTSMKSIIKQITKEKLDRYITICANELDKYNKEIDIVNCIHLISNTIINDRLVFQSNILSNIKINQSISKVVEKCKFYNGLCKELDVLVNISSYIYKLRQSIVSSEITTISTMISKFQTILNSYISIVTPYYDNLSDHRKNVIGLLNNTITNEYNDINNYLTILLYEKDLLNTLEKCSIKAEAIGKLDLASIKVNELREILDKRNELIDVPDKLQHIINLSIKIYELRLTLMNNQWDKISKLIEDIIVFQSKIPDLPSFIVTEVQTIRFENENRWICHTLTNNLLDGQIVGDCNNYSISTLNYITLMINIKTCKEIKPRTQQAIQLLNSAEIIWFLRQTIKENSKKIPWEIIRSKTFELLIKSINFYSNKSNNISNYLTQYIQQNNVQSNVINEISDIIINELENLFTISENEVISEKIMNQLISYSIIGLPGQLDISLINLTDLQFTIHSTNELVNISDKNSILLNCLQLVEKLRRVYLYIYNYISTTTDSFKYSNLLEKWSQINCYLDEYKVFVTSNTINSELINKSNDIISINYWLLIQPEVKLLEKESLIFNLYVSLEDNCRKMIEVYNNRLSLSINVDATINEITLDTQELIELIEKINTYSFSCDVLDKLNKCIKCLIELRGSINSNDIKKLDDMIVGYISNYTKDILSFCYITKKEYKYIVNEYYNIKAVEMLNKYMYLNINNKDSEESLIVNDPDNNKDKKVDTLQLSQLKYTIDIIDSYKLTGLLAIQLFECSQYFYKLRYNILVNNSVDIELALNWFHSNSQRCPIEILNDIKQIYNKYTNSNILKQLKQELQSNTITISASTGDSIYSTISYEKLAELIHQAMSLEDKDNEIDELVELSTYIYHLRYHLLTSNYTELNNILMSFESLSSINPLISNELLLVKRDADDHKSIDCLLDAISSFDDTISNNIFETIYKSSYELNSQLVNSRRYSYVMKYEYDIDFNTVDINIIDDAIEKSRKIGIYSSRCKRLYRTVQLLKSIRLAMKQFDWLGVEKLMENAQIDKNMGIEYDESAKKEFEVIEHQLKMRRGVIELYTELCKGQPICKNGYVDTTNIRIDQLKEAIDKAGSSLEYLNNLNITNPIYLQGGIDKYIEKYTDKYLDKYVDTSINSESIVTVNKYIEILINSCKLIMKLRELLVNGNIELVGQIANDKLSEFNNLVYHVVIKPELTLYDIEINQSIQNTIVINILNECINSNQINVIYNNIMYIYDKYINNKCNFYNNLNVIKLLSNIIKKYHRYVYVSKLIDSIQSDDKRLYDIKQLKEIINLIDKSQLINKKFTKFRLFYDKNVDFLNLYQKYLDKHQNIIKNNDLINLIEYGLSNSLSNHPIIKYIKLLCRISDSTIRTITISKCISTKSINPIVNEIVVLRKMYLSIDYIKQKYNLENYSHLRNPIEFLSYHNHYNQDIQMLLDKQNSSSNNNLAAELSNIINSMLSHSNKPIPTSLTNLPSTLSALSIWLFTHCVRGVERNIYTYIEYQLRNMINIGRYIPRLRDEIYLQLTKQMTKNNDIQNCNRLWRCLYICLLYFPTSNQLLNYLECFLYSYIYKYTINITNRKQSTVQSNNSFLSPSSTLSSSILSTNANKIANEQANQYRCTLAKISIQALHYSIVKYGYNKVILDPLDISLKQLRNQLFDINIEQLASNNQIDLLFDKANDVSMHQIRGIKENWKKRFSYFIGSYINTSNNNANANSNVFIQEDDFITAMTNIKSIADYQDIMMIIYLLFDYDINCNCSNNNNNNIKYERINIMKIYHELVNDDELYYNHYDITTYYNKCRYDWLDKHITLYQTNHPYVKSYDQLDNIEINEVMHQFWLNIIESLIIENEKNEKFNFSNKLWHDNEVVQINYEIYHDLVIIAMNKYINKHKWLFIRSNNK